MIKFLCWLKVNLIELSDMDISHEEFMTILNEKDEYEKMKENVRNISGKLK